MFKPKFIITPEINNKIAEVEKLKTIFDQANIIPELAIELRFRATVESIHSSTSIEGNPLNQQEVKKVLEGSTISAPDYAIQEVLNYKNALHWINQKKETQDILNSNEILKLHSILMENLLPSQKIGNYRSGDVYIIDEVNTTRGTSKKEIVQYVGPQASDLKKILSSFTAWVKIQKKEKKLHPVLLAGLAHFIFVSIHPFSDGNGRTTRLLTHQFLKSYSYDFNDSLSLDSYYLQNRKNYYKALSRGKTFEDRVFADITPFLEFFVEGFLQSVRTLTKYVQIGKVLDDNQKPIRLNQEELLILDYVYQFKSINIEEALTVIQATKRTTQRRLSKLVKNKILKIEGKGPSTTYILFNT